MLDGYVVSYLVGAHHLREPIPGINMGMTNAVCPLPLRYARAVEAALSLSLNAFLVSDLHDCRLLQQLVRQAGLTGESSEPGEALLTSPKLAWMVWVA